MQNIKFVFRFQAANQNVQDARQKKDQEAQ